MEARGKPIVHHVQINPTYECDSTPELKNEKYPILEQPELNPSYTEATFLNSDNSDGPPGTDIPARPIRKQIFIGHAFAVSLVVVEVLGLCCIASMIIWMSNYHNGLKWDGGSKEFNLHGVFMVTGLVYCYANAAVTSYIFQRQSETCVHYLHCVVLMLTFLFTVLGTITGIEVKTTGEITNLKSFHSWLGLITLILFGCQTIVGFVGLFPKLGHQTRKHYVKLQIWVALLVFALSIMTSLLGIADKLSLSPNRSNVEVMAHERITSNVSSLFIVAFGVLVSCLLLQPLYRQVR